MRCGYDETDFSQYYLSDAEKEKIEQKIQSEEDFRQKVKKHLEAQGVLEVAEDLYPDLALCPNDILNWNKNQLDDWFYQMACAD